MEKFNSAARLHRLFQSATQANQQAPAVAVWAGVFDIHIKDPNRLLMAVTGKLELVAEELDDVERRMRTTPDLYVQARTYEAPFGQLRNALNVAGLESPFGQLGHYIDNYTLLALDMCAGALPHEGDPIAEEDLEEIAAKLTELREHVEASELPDDAKAFFLGHISILEEALRDYRIRGPVVFVGADGAARILTALNKDLIEEHQDDGVFRGFLQRLRESYEWFGERARQFNTVANTLKALGWAAEGLRALGDNLPDLPG